MRAENAWSERSNTSWIRVPDDVADSFGMHGTANWRLVPDIDPGEALILSDADTVLIDTIDPALYDFPKDRPCIAGHMAHFPPPISWLAVRPEGRDPDFWPSLFD